MCATHSELQADDPPPDRDGVIPQFWWTPRWAYIVTGATTVVFLIADLVLPRGATVAIGYCIVPAIAAGTRRLGFLLGMVITCTVLTWIAFFVEPRGYPGWKSAFDRAMVTGVLWFAFALVLRRAIVIRELLRQRRALEAATLELERSNQELSTFASVVAHDLRGPLNTVGLFAQLLARSPAIIGNAECGEFLSSIKAELARMSGFIQSLLAYGRVGSGEIKRLACDCAAVLDDVRQRLAADLERTGAEVTTESLPVIRADPVLVAELFQNLIENGIKYHGEAPPRIHVSAVQRPDGWRFSVRDNGIGIRPEDCDRIFEPFCQANEDRSHGKGVGLGLATCKRIVERHGGRIHVQSKPGEGATFLFTLGPDSSAAATVTRSAMNAADAIARVD